MNMLASMTHWYKQPALHLSAMLFIANPRDFDFDPVDFGPVQVKQNVEQDLLRGDLQRWIRQGLFK